MGRRSQQKMTTLSVNKRVERAKDYAIQREKERQEQERKQVELMLKALLYAGARRQ